MVAPEHPLNATPGTAARGANWPYAVSLVPGTLGRGVIVFLGLENTTIRYGTGGGALDQGGWQGAQVRPA